MISHSNRPRYTLRGSPDVERHIRRLLSRIAGAVAKDFVPTDYRALVLLGGYGRGEGGVLRQHGKELPHNNLDLLLVAKPRACFRQSVMGRRLSATLSGISREEGIGIDAGVIGEFALRFAPPRIIWFDMRWGHRTILGDAGFVPSLRPVSAKSIKMDEVHDLLVNRASLLVINDAILARSAPTETERKIIIKHAMKAILGHGDALLFVHGRYHAGYVEKQRRMRELQRVLPGMAELYDEAADFRFEPSYERYTGTPFASFVANTRIILRESHLLFERVRARDPVCSFRGHPNRLVSRPIESPRAFLASAKSLLHSLQNRSAGPNLPLDVEFAIRRAHPRTVLAAALPIVLYGPDNDEDATLVKHLLSAEATSPDALRRAYLAHWSKYGDPNFHNVAKQLGLSFGNAETLS